MIQIITYNINNNKNARIALAFYILMHDNDFRLTRQMHVTIIVKVSCFICCNFRFSEKILIHQDLF